MKNIKNLYYNYTQTNEYMSTAEPAELLENWKTVEGKYGDESSSRPEEISSLAFVCETNGFVLGFRYAMRLAAECGLPGAMPE